MAAIEAESLTIRGEVVKRRLPLDIPRGQWYVYSWFREGVCLYVGMTGNAAKRFITHYVLGGTEPVEDNDILFLEPQPDRDTALRYENDLILAAQPVFNVQCKQPLQSKKRMLLWAHKKLELLHQQAHEIAQLSLQ